jgi:hypothetical protein
MMKLRSNDPIKKENENIYKAIHFSLGLYLQDLMLYKVVDKLCYLFIYLFIYGLSTHTLDSTDYKVLHDRMINEQLIRKDMEWNCHGIIWGISLTFDWG